MLKRKIISAAIAVGVLVSIASAAYADSTQVMTTFDAQKNSWYVFAGGVTAISGENLSSQDGWLARLTGGYGQYSYGTLFKGGAGGIATNIDGDVTDGDLMVGYQHYMGVTRLTAYLGGDIENQNLSPDDPSSKVHGTRGGVKGQLEIASELATNVPVFALGNYSTAFESYYSQGTVGYNFGHFVLGPAIGFQGSESYNEVKYGAKLSQIDLGFAQTAIDVGGEHSNRSNGSGVYGGIGFFKNF